MTTGKININCAKIAQKNFSRMPSLDEESKNILTHITNSFIAAEASGRYQEGFVKYIDEKHVRSYYKLMHLHKIHQDNIFDMQLIFKLFKKLCIETSSMELRHLYLTVDGNNSSKDKIKTINKIYEEITDKPLSTPQAVSYRRALSYLLEIFGFITYKCQEGRVVNEKKGLFHKGHMRYSVNQEALNMKNLSELRYFLTILENFNSPKKVTRTMKFEYHKRCALKKYVQRQIRELKIWKNILIILLGKKQHFEARQAVRELTSKFINRNFDSREDHESLKKLTIITKQIIRESSSDIDQQQKKEIRKIFKNMREIMLNLLLEEDRLEDNYSPPKCNPSCSERNYYNYLWAKDKKEVFRLIRLSLNSPQVVE